MELILTLAIYTLLLQTAIEGRMGVSKPQLLGAQKRSIVLHSPDVRITIANANPLNPGNYKGWVRVEIENTSDVDLIDELSILDVRPLGGQAKPAETPAGCAANIFSACHTTPLDLPNVSLRRPTIGPHKTLSFTEPASVSYTLSKGRYSVSGVFCRDLNLETPCVRSNTIVVEIE